MPNPWTAQFHIQHGDAVEESPHIGVYGKAGPSGRASLYVVAEAGNSPDSDAFCGQLVGTVATELRLGGLSATSGLTSALNTAHAQLQELNRETDSGEQMFAGASCAVVQGNDLYLAQVGPSLTYVYSEDRIKRHVPPYNVREVNISESLGIAKEPKVHLQHHAVKAGDIVLLASSSLGQLLTSEELVVILTSEPDQAIQRLYLVARKEERISALLLAFP